MYSDGARDGLRGVGARGEDKTTTDRAFLTVSLTLDYFSWVFFLALFHVRPNGSRDIKKDKKKKKKKKKKTTKQPSSFLYDSDALLLAVLC